MPLDSVSEAVVQIGVLSGRPALAFEGAELIFLEGRG